MRPPPRSSTIDASMTKPKKRARPTPARIRTMIEESTVDAYGRSEEMTGWATMIGDQLDLPFETVVLGVVVNVVTIDLGRDDSLVAICQRGRTKQRVALEDLPLPKTRRRGAEWIYAYRVWLDGS